MKVLVIGKQSMGFGAMNVDVENAEDSKDDRKLKNRNFFFQIFKKLLYIFLQRRLFEVVVHQMGTVQQQFEVLESNVHRNGKANGRPQWVTSAHPIPEFKPENEQNLETYIILMRNGGCHWQK